MASFLALQTPVAVSSLASSSSHLVSQQGLQECCSFARTVLVAKDGGGGARSQHRESSVSTGSQVRRLSVSPLHVMKDSGGAADFEGDSTITSSGTERDVENESTSIAPLVWKTSPATEQGLVVSTSTGAPLQSLTKDAAMGLVLREAVGTSWTTGSGLEGPTEAEEDQSEPALKFPDLSKSPRRRMRVAFTCNRCGERTVRAINPLAYTDGTVFVQCKGCDVFHKLIDNLNLFHEMKGKIYRGYDIPWYASEQPYNFLDDNYPML